MRSASFIWVQFLFLLLSKVQNTVTIFTLIFTACKSSGCFESQKKPREIEQIRNFLANHKMCLLNSVKSSRTRLFYQKSHRCAEVRELRPRAQSFFLQEAVLGRRLLQVGSYKCRRNCDARGNRPPDFDRNQRKPASSKYLILLLVVHLDFQTFLRPCAIDGLWARLFWHLWMHVVFDSPADPTNLNKKESCSCSISPSPQSETCLPTTRHLFALCFRKMPVVEVCHMSTHKIWIQIHST